MRRGDKNDKPVIGVSVDAKDGEQIGGRFGGGGSTGSYTGRGGYSGGAGGSYLPPAGSAGSTFNSRAAWIIENLKRDFDLTTEQAAGIVGNLAHESGGFRHYQEIGSTSNTGGRGWAQWTGPRRIAFLNWSRSHGLDPRSDEASYGYLSHELRTTEAGSLRAVRRAETARAATYAFERSFERAGVKAYRSRLRYTAQALHAARTHKPEPAPAPERPLDPITPTTLWLPTTITRYKVNNMYFPSDQHGSRNMMRRVTVMEIDDANPQQTIWAKGLYGEEIKGAYRAQGHGLSTVPPVGSEGFAFSLAGRPDQMFFLESEHPDHRPKGQQPGDAVLYDAYGNTIKMESGGVTHNNTKHTFNGPIEINGDVTINGNITHDGDMSTSGEHTDSNGQHS